MILILDTDAMLALADSRDSQHTKAKNLIKKLQEQSDHLVVLPTTLGEFALVGNYKIGLDRVKTVLDIWRKEENGKILEIDQDLASSAIVLYQKQTSKKESMFDCFIMAAASKYGYNTIFSFDRGYKKTINAPLNLKLISDLYPGIN